MPRPFDETVPPAVAQADDALAFIESELPGIDAVSATLNQRTHGDGTPYDVMDIGWKIRQKLVDDFAGLGAWAEGVRQSLAVTTVTYYSHPDASKEWATIALGEIVLKASKILSIYAGLPNRVDLPDADYPPGMFGR